MSNRICFVMPTMSGGGAERVVSVLANEFIKAGYDVTLMLTNSTQIFSHFLRGSDKKTRLSYRSVMILIGRLGIEGSYLRFILGYIRVLIR